MVQVRNIAVMRKINVLSLAVPELALALALVLVQEPVPELVLALAQVPEPVRAPELAVLTRFALPSAEFKLVVRMVVMAVAHVPAHLLAGAVEPPINISPRPVLVAIAPGIMPTMNRTR